MPSYQRSTVHTVSDIRAIADHAGSHFFSKGAIRAFSSKVISGVYAPDGNDVIPGNRFLFVTSEKYGDDMPRHYAVRMLTLGTVRDNRPHADIMSIGHHHDTVESARAEARKLANELQYLSA